MKLWRDSANHHLCGKGALTWPSCNSTAGLRHGPGQGDTTMGGDDFQKTDRDRDTGLRQALSDQSPASYPMPVEANPRDAQRPGMGGRKPQLPHQHAEPSRALGASSAAEASAMDPGIEQPGPRKTGGRHQGH